jgi:hypothetical protein
MPSQINNPGNVVNVTANYLKTKPSTRFSTRDLAFLEIDMDDNSYFDDYALPDSTFSRVVRLVQTQAEIYAVGTPNNGVVIIVVAIDTAGDGNNTDGGLNGRAKTIYDALQDADIDVYDVSFRRLYGSGFTGQDMYGYGTGGETFVD